MTTEFAEVWLDGELWLVTPIPIGPVSIGGAKAQVEVAGLQLPTPALVDAIWRAADMKISPAYIIQTHDGSFKGMNSDEINAKVLAGIEEALDGKSFGLDFQLAAGGMKEVIEVDGKLGLYGMHVDDVSVFEARLRNRLGITMPTHAPETPGEGHVVQPPYFKHSLIHKDYSQSCRGVKSG